MKSARLPEAIRELNEVIAREYPGRSKLLVAYVPPTKQHPKTPRRRIDLNLVNVPIQTVVTYLTERVITAHWRVKDGTIIVYGWQHREDDR